MSEQEKNGFEQQFKSAISSSLKRVTVSDEFRQKLMGRLEIESRDAIPRDLSEEVAGDFEHQMARAVQRSQDWAPEGKIVLQTESAISAEIGRNVLSERSVYALLDGAQPPAELSKMETPLDKVTFLKTIRSEVRRTTQELKAPESVRQRVIKALEGGMASSRGRVVALPSRAQWSRGLKTLTSLAAAFALVFLTIFGSADAALANSVRADHKMCCDRALKMQPDGGPPTGVQAMLQSKYGAVPVPPIDSSWGLRVSNICRADDGQPMIHLLYTRDGQDGKMESISFHFLPDQEGKRAKKYALSEVKIQEISDGDFPVIGWTEGDWVCTACSPELSSQELKQTFSSGL